MANVVAIERGYFGGAIREPGDRFPIPDGRPVPSWARLADREVAPDEKPVPRRGRKPRVTTEPVAASEDVEIMSAVEPDWLPPEHQEDI